MDIKICKLSELSEELVDQSVAILVDGLYDGGFSAISKDKNILKELFKDSLVYDMNYACLCDGEVAGYLGVGNSSTRPAGNMKRETFERLFGKLRGGMMYKPVSKGFCEPFVESDEEIEIGFLVTNPRFRGRGIATQLIRYVCENFDYKYCVLDVLSKNTNAKRLYEKLGFKQVKVKSDWLLRLHGIGNAITMRLEL